MLARVRSGRGGARALLMAVAALALLLRLAVPAGWMPVRGADGIHLAPCDGRGPIMAGQMAGMTHDRHGGSPAHHQGGDGEHRCEFAAAAQAADLPPVVGVTVPAPEPSAPPRATTLVVTIGHGLAAPPPPSTGPPLLA